MLNDLTKGDAETKEQVRAELVRAIDELVTATLDPLEDVSIERGPEQPSVHPCSKYSGLGVELPGYDVPMSADGTRAFANLLYNTQFHKHKTRCDPRTPLQKLKCHHWEVYYNTHRPTGTQALWGQPCIYSFPRLQTNDTTVCYRSGTHVSLSQLQVDHRRPNVGSRYVNAANPLMLDTWRANQDLQLIDNKHGAKEYVTKYISKGEIDEKMYREKLQTKLAYKHAYAMADGANVDTIFHTAMFIVGGRTIGAQEAAWILLGYELVESSVKPSSFVSLQVNIRRHISPDNAACHRTYTIAPSPSCRPSSGRRWDDLEIATRSYFPRGIQPMVRMKMRSRTMMPWMGREDRCYDTLRLSTINTWTL